MKKTAVILCTLFLLNLIPLNVFGEVPSSMEQDGVEITYSSENKEKVETNPAEYDDIDDTEQFNEYEGDENTSINSDDHKRVPYAELELKYSKEAKDAYKMEASVKLILKDGTAYNYEFSDNFKDGHVNKLYLFAEKEYFLKDIDKIQVVNSSETEEKFRLEYISLYPMMVGNSIWNGYTWEHFPDGGGKNEAHVYKNGKHIWNVKINKDDLVKEENKNYYREYSNDAKTKDTVLVTTPIGTKEDYKYNYGYDTLAYELDTRINGKQSYDTVNYRYLITFTDEQVKAHNKTLETKDPMDDAAYLFTTKLLNIKTNSVSSFSLSKFIEKGAHINIQQYNKFGEKIESYSANGHLDGSYSGGLYSKANTEGFDMNSDNVIKYAKKLSKDVKFIILNMDMNEQEVQVPETIKYNVFNKRYGSFTLLENVLSKELSYKTYNKIKEELEKAGVPDYIIKFILENVAGIEDGNIGEAIVGYLPPLPKITSDKIVKTINKYINSEELVDINLNREPIEPKNKLEGYRAYFDIPIDENTPFNDGKVKITIKNKYYAGGRDTNNMSVGYQTSDSSWYWFGAEDVVYNPDKSGEYAVYEINIPNLNCNEIKGLRLAYWNEFTRPEDPAKVFAESFQDAINTPAKAKLGTYPISDKAARDIKKLLEDAGFNEFMGNGDVGTFFAETILSNIPYVGTAIKLMGGTDWVAEKVRYIFNKEEIKSYAKFAGTQIIVEDFDPEDPVITACNLQMYVSDAKTVSEMKMDKNFNYEYAQNFNDGESNFSKVKDWDGKSSYDCVNRELTALKEDRKISTDATYTYEDLIYEADVYLEEGSSELFFKLNFDNQSYKNSNLEPSYKYNWTKDVKNNKQADYDSYSLCLYRFPKNPDAIGFDLNKYIKSETGFSQFRGHIHDTSDVSKDNWYHVKIVSIGNEIQVYINDMFSPKLSANDIGNGTSIYHSGKIGVRTCSKKNKFDNITVKHNIEYYEDWSSGCDATDYILDFDDYSQSTGNFLIIPPGDNNTAILDGYYFDNYTYTFDFTVNNKDRKYGDAGLLFNITNYDKGKNGLSCYQVALNEKIDEVRLGKFIDGNFGGQLARASFKIEDMKTYRVKVKHDSGLIEIYVDDMKKPLITYYDEEHLYPSGQVGFRAWLNKALFDNFVIENNN